MRDPYAMNAREIKAIRERRAKDARAIRERLRRETLSSDTLHFTVLKSAPDTGVAV